MEEFNAFMIAINPYGLINWLVAFYCAYVTGRTGSGLILFLCLLNVLFGIFIILVN